MTEQEDHADAYTSDHHYPCDRCGHTLGVHDYPLGPCVNCTCPAFKISSWATADKAARALKAHRIRHGGASRPT